MESFVAINPLEWTPRRNRSGEVSTLQVESTRSKTDGLTLTSLSAAEGVMFKGPLKHGGQEDFLWVRRHTAQETLGCRKPASGPAQPENSTLLVASEPDNRA